MTTYSVETDNAGLWVEDLAALREQLHEQRLFRLQQLRQLTRSAPAVKGTRGASDLPARVQVHRELTVSARTVLAEVEAALRRMDEGCYGSCHHCGRPISLPRLRIMPQSRRCADCHRAEETG
jgi:DnaK suppressor protein